MRIKEFTGKTTKEAIDNGLAELGVTIADVHVDVLQEGAKGLFGLFGSKPACVRLTVMDDRARGRPRSERSAGQLQPERSEKEVRRQAGRAEARTRQARRPQGGSAEAREPTGSPEDRPG